MQAVKLRRGRLQKSQSAMEYLMTYGWAILIIAVVLGALFQLGVFSGIGTPKAQPGNCQVVRVGSGITQTVSLEGECQGQEPEYVGAFGASTQTYIWAPFSPTLQTPQQQSQLTLSAWIYEQPNNDCEVGVAILAPLSGGAYPVDWAYRFGVSGGSVWHQPNVVMLELFNTGTGQTNMYGSTAIPYSSWENIAATYNGAAVQFYLNGQPAGSTAYNSLVDPGTSNDILIIGGNPNSGCSASFPGYVSNLQIYNYTLSASEITALYNEGIGGAPIRPQNIVGWWPLNGNAQDYSGNNGNGQAEAGVTYSSSWTSGYTAP